MVRPTPQRPPIVSTSAAETIEALSARIATLEQTIIRQQVAISKSEQEQALVRLTYGDSASLRPSSRLLDGPPDPSDSSSADESARIGGPHALIDHNVQAAAAALAQLSLAPRAEYVGGGTILCAIHRLGDVDGYRVAYAPSTSMMSAITTPFFPGVHSFLSPIRGLIAGIPARPLLEEYIESFFAHRNWEFLIPENWVRGATRRDEELH